MAAFSSTKSDYIANVFRVYNNDYLNDENFMVGWRRWSFNMTQRGNSASMVVTKFDKQLIQQMRTKGNEVKNESKNDWNKFRSRMFNIVPGINSRMHYHEQYRLIFKRVAFVLVDCCFAVKYKCDPAGLRQLLSLMFKQTGTEEEPTYFIILENDLTNSEFDHKLSQHGRFEYVNTQKGIHAYRQLNPTLSNDRMVKMSAPFMMTHNAMVNAETKVRNRKLASRAQAWEPPQLSEQMNRAAINDNALIQLMSKVRRSFGLCARVALLTDDFKMISKASSFRATGGANSYKNLPLEYTTPFFVTPSLLSHEEWVEWRRDHVYDAFSAQFK